MDDDALTGPMDAAKPWTIKSVGTDTRDRAIAAARREGITVGQWLDRRMREWDAPDTSQLAPRDSRTPAGEGAVILGQPKTANQGRPLDSEGVAQLRDAPAKPEEFARDCTGLAELVGAAVSLSELTAEQRRDPLLRTARGTVRAALLALRPRRPAGAAQALQAPPGPLRLGAG